MGQENRVEVDRLVAVLPQIFFFLPTLPPHRLPDVGDDLPDSSIGVLWLAVMLEKEDCHELGELRRIFSHWWPQHSKKSDKSGFSRFKTPLVDHGLIEESLADVDHRKHRFTITEKGRDVIQQVIAERTRGVNAVIQTLPREVVANVVELSERVGPLLWKRLRQRMRIIKTSA